MIKNYRKKPVVIQAVQWDGTYQSMERIRHELGISTINARFHISRNEVTNWTIKTLEGGHDVSKNDFIIKGVKGEFYPCKPDIFEMTYEEVKD
jgi:hypothetical protein